MKTVRLIYTHTGKELPIHRTDDDIKLFKRFFENVTETKKCQSMKAFMMYLNKQTQFESLENIKYISEPTIIQCDYCKARSPFSQMVDHYPRCKYASAILSLIYDIQPNPVILQCNCCKAQSSFIWIIDHWPQCRYANNKTESIIYGSRVQSDPAFMSTVSIIDKPFYIKKSKSPQLIGTTYNYTDFAISLWNKKTKTAAILKTESSINEEFLPFNCKETVVHIIGGNSCIGTTKKIQLILTAFKNCSIAYINYNDISFFRHFAINTMTGKTYIDDEIHSEILKEVYSPENFNKVFIVDLEEF